MGTEAQGAIELEEEEVNYHDSCWHANYGLTCRDIDEMLEYADRCCEICGLPEIETKRGRLCIDHLPGYVGNRLVRGLLCDKCNTLMARMDAGRIKYAGPMPIRYRENAWFARKFRDLREYEAYELKATS